jgi:hypothetical protein
VLQGFGDSARGAFWEEFKVWDMVPKASYMVDSTTIVKVVHFNDVVVLPVSPAARTLWTICPLNQYYLLNLYSPYPLVCPPCSIGFGALVMVHQIVAYSGMCSKPDFLPLTRLSPPEGPPEE